MQLSFLSSFPWLESVWWKHSAEHGILSSIFPSQFGRQSCVLFSSDVCLVSDIIIFQFYSYLPHSFSSCTLPAFYITVLHISHDELKGLNATTNAGVIGIITAFSFRFKRCIAQMQLNLLELCVARLSWSFGVFIANQPTQLIVMALLFKLLTKFRGSWFMECA